MAGFFCLKFNTEQNKHHVQNCAKYNGRVAIIKKIVKLTDYVCAQSSKMQQQTQKA